MYDGKRSTAEKILYEALDKIKEKGKEDPIKVFNNAINNVITCPMCGGITVNMGTITFQSVPITCSETNFQVIVPLAMPQQIYPFTLNVLCKFQFLLYSPVYTYINTFYVKYLSVKKHFSFTCYYLIASISHNRPPVCSIGGYFISICISGR